MRIIGHIEHPHLKITVFKTGERVSVKFENALYEQTYKLGTDERFGSLEAVQQWADELFLQQVSAHFQQMHQARMAASARTFSSEDAPVFEEII